MNDCFGLLMHQRRLVAGLLRTIWGSLQAMSPIITFRMSHRRREMYIGRLPVCVSVGPIANL